MKLSKSNIGLLSVIAVLLIVISVMVYKDFSYRKNIGNVTETPITTEGTTEKTTETSTETYDQIRTQDILSKYTAAIELDEECKRRLSNAQSNFEITEINSEFADKWKEEIDTNYQNLLTVSWKFLNEKAVASQAEWYIYAEKRIDEEREYLLQQYTTGTIVSVKMSEFEYDLYRERALELFEMYYELKSQEEIMGPSWREHWESVRGGDDSMTDN